MCWQWSLDDPPTPHAPECAKLHGCQIAVFVRVWKEMPSETPLREVRLFRCNKRAETIAACLHEHLISRKIEKLIRCHKWLAHLCCVRSFISKLTKPHRGFHRVRTVQEDVAPDCRCFRFRARLHERVVYLNGLKPKRQRAVLSCLIITDAAAKIDGESRISFQGRSPS